MKSNVVTQPAVVSVAAEDGLSLHSEAFGPPGGPVLLLIMGAMNPGLFWPVPLCDLLTAAGWRVLRYDHRDTGRSSTVDMARHPYTLDDLTEDARAVLDAHGVDRAVVVGLSMGGYIAQLLALRHPRRVRALVLLSTTADHRPYMDATLGRLPRRSPLPPPTSGFLEFVAKAARARPPSADAAAELQLDGWRAVHGGSLPFPEQLWRELIAQAMAITREPAAALHHAAAVDASPSRTDWLPDIGVPARVIHGAYDPCLPLAHGRHLAAHLAQARLRVLDMGHLLPPPLWPCLIEEIMALVPCSAA
jgi:pimeloyl-ACP methyl ester carboxylesterase